MLNRYLPLRVKYLFYKRQDFSALLLLFFSIYFGFFRNHTENFSWMHVISFENLLKLSDYDIFFNTLIPVFRPLLHAEKAFGNFCGEACVANFNKTIYFFGCLLYLFLLKTQISVLTKENKINVVCVFVGVLLYIYLFSFGSVTDILYPASVCALINIFFNERSVCFDWRIVIIIAILFFIADNSRPFFIFIFPLWFLMAFFQKNKSFVYGVVIGLCICYPYHVSQYKNTGSIILSNYGGCNISEILRNKEFEEKRISVEVEKINSNEGTKVCKEIEREVFDYCFATPLKAIVNILSPIRLLRIIAPAPFSPYQPIPEFDKGGAIKWMVWLMLCVLLYIPIFKFFVAEVNKSAKENSAASATLILILIIPLFFSLFAHSGEESGRVGMSYILTLVFYYFFKSKSENGFNCN